MTQMFGFISAATFVVTLASLALTTRRSGFGSVKAPSEIAARASDVVLALVLVRTFTPWSSIPVSAWWIAVGMGGLVAGFALQRTLQPWGEPGWGRRRDAIHAATSLAAGLALALL